jgi:hypothetical protein
MMAVAQLVGSLIAILGLGWIARWLQLGGDSRIVGEDHAKQIAFDGLYGFKAVDAVVDLGGYSALVKDAANRHVLIATKGNKFITRMLRPPIEGRLDQKFLTIDVREPDVEPVTLNLGPDAQYWASGLRHIPCA